MTNEQKPREFLVRPRRIKKGPTWNCTDNLMKYAGYTDIIHVIEYSEYNKLEKENKELKNKIHSAITTLHSLKELIDWSDQQFNNLKGLICNTLEYIEDNK